MIDIKPSLMDKRNQWVFTTEVCREQVIAAIVPGLSELRERFTEDKVSKIVPLLADIRRFLDDYRN